MINLYKQTEYKKNNKSLYAYHKSHTASMNLKLPQDVPFEGTHREALKNSYRLPD